MYNTEDTLGAPRQMNIQDFIFQTVSAIHKFNKLTTRIICILFSNPLSTFAAYSQLVNDPVVFNRGQNLTIHTAAQDKLSFLRVYYDPAEYRIFPFLTAVVDVENGIVLGVAWDDACVFCSKSRCMENMYNFDGVSASELGVKSPSKGCYFTQEECNKIHAEGGTDCDVTLYVVWTGSDKDGKSFQSSGKRFSAFPPGKLQDRLLNQLPSFSDLNPFG